MKLSDLNTLTDENGNLLPEFKMRIATVGTLTALTRIKIKGYKPTIQQLKELYTECMAGSGKFVVIHHKHHSLIAAVMFWYDVNHNMVNGTVFINGNTNIDDDHVVAWASSDETMGDHLKTLSGMIKPTSTNAITTLLATAEKANLFPNQTSWWGLDRIRCTPSNDITISSDDIDNVMVLQGEGIEVPLEVINGGKSICIFIKHKDVCIGYLGSYFNHEKGVWVTSAGLINNLYKNDEEYDKLLVEMTWLLFQNYPLIETTQLYYDITIPFKTLFCYTMHDVICNRKGDKSPFIKLTCYDAN